MTEDEARAKVDRLFADNRDIIRTIYPEEGNAGPVEKPKPKGGAKCAAKRAESETAGSFHILVTGELAAEFEKRRVEIFQKTGKLPTRTGLIRILLGR